MLMNDITREQLIENWEALYDAMRERPIDIRWFLTLFKMTRQYFSDLAKNDSVALEDIRIVNLLNRFQIILFCEYEPMMIAEKNGLEKEYCACEWFISRLLENIPNRELASGGLIIKERDRTSIVFMEDLEKAFYERVDMFSDISEY